MDPLTLAAFLFVVALGAYVQTVTGFALGLIVMGGITLFDLAPVAFTAIVVGFTALANNFLALHRAMHHIDRRGVSFTLLGMLPAIGLGVLLLDALHSTSVETLRVILGVVILTGGVLLALRPHPHARRAPGWVDAGVGVAGGILAGMFSIGGPPLVFHFYRQPLPLAVVRATLLATFAVATVARLFYVGVAGDITLEMVQLSLLCLPVVFLATVAGRRYPPPLPDLAMRRFAFTLLGAIGVMLLV
ncbi:MAG: sulfite exporter TauE/SafE family protein [Pseudomonadota bacterium]